MKAKPQGNNGTNLVEAAQSALAEAQGKLAAHDQRKSSLDAERARLTAALDQATLQGDGKASDQTARDLAMVTELIASVIRVRGPLAASVTGAEQRLVEAKAQAAQQEITQLAKQKVEILTAIVEKVGEVCELLTDARGLQTQMDALATDHNLPTPPRQRLMLERSLVRSPSGEELAAALGAERVFGLDRTPAL